MIKPAILSAGLLLASLSVQAQANATATEQPFKKANTVLIITSDSISGAVRKLGAILVSQGYTIKKLDTDFNTLLTEPKAMAGTGFNSRIVLRAAPAANGLALSGELISNMSAISPGMDNVSARISSSGKEPKGYFRRLIDIASSYPGAKLQYSQQ